MHTYGRVKRTALGDWHDRAARGVGRCPVMTVFPVPTGDPLVGDSQRTSRDLLADF